jgi:hypothetical protein
MKCVYLFIWEELLQFAVQTFHYENPSPLFRAIERTPTRPVSNLPGTSARNLINCSYDYGINSKRAPHFNLSCVEIRTRAVQHKSKLCLYASLRSRKTAKNLQRAGSLSNTDYRISSRECVVEKEMSDLSSLTMIQLLEMQWR